MFDKVLIAGFTSTSTAEYGAGFEADFAVHKLQKLSIRTEYHHNPEIPLSYKSSQSSCGKQNN